MILKGTVNNKSCPVNIDRLNQSRQRHRNFSEACNKFPKNIVGSLSATVIKLRYKPVYWSTYLLFMLCKHQTKRRSHRTPRSGRYSNSELAPKYDNGLVYADVNTPLGRNVGALKCCIRKKSSGGI